MKNKILTGICILLILLIIGLAVAQLTDSNLIKETDKYKVTRTTLDDKEALHFELKKEVLATDLIKEAIEIQEKEKESKEVK